MKGASASRVTGLTMRSGWTTSSRIWPARGAPGGTAAATAPSSVWSRWASAAPMTATPGAPRVVSGVEPVSAESRQVDPAHERRFVVDDDELLVVAVERALLGVEAHRDPR